MFSTLYSNMNWLHLSFSATRLKLTPFAFQINTNSILSIFLIEFFFHSQLVDKFAKLIASFIYMLSNDKNQNTFSDKTACKNVFNFFFSEKVFNTLHKIIIFFMLITNLGPFHKFSLFFVHFFCCLYLVGSLHLQTRKQKCLAIFFFFYYIFFAFLQLR